MNFSKDNWWTITNEHQIIRDTIGYDGIKEIDPIDMPQVMDFLQIVWNYTKMHKILKDEKIIEN
jgi:hypothetical protein